MSLAVTQAACQIMVDLPAVPEDAASADALSDALPDALPDALADASADVSVDAPADVPIGPEASVGDAGRTYVNPVFAEDFPDPFVLRAGSAWYAFATNSAGKNVRAARSDDLARWTELPDALPSLPAWAKSGASLTWAPSVLARGAGFVLYYTARDLASGYQCISRAVATDPAGPYVDDSTAPFVCQVEGEEALCGSIDPSPFVDHDGVPYLVWKSDENAPDCHGDARIWAQRLTDDGLSVVGPRAALLARDRGWEHPLVEGPSMIARGGRLHLFYSAGWWESTSYAVGWATCAGPLGPCTKHTTSGPLFGSKGSAVGPGGQHPFVDDEGRTWMAYHAWTAPLVGYGAGGARTLRIDRLDLAAEVPVLDGPTTTPTPL